MSDSGVLLRAICAETACSMLSASCILRMWSYIHRSGSSGTAPSLAILACANFAVSSSGRLLSSRISGSPPCDTASGVIDESNRPA